MNKCILVGRITKDPEVKRTSSDLPYCQFTLAVNRKYQNKQTSERQADFINCIAWRQSAELLGRFIHKGNQIGVEGSIQTRSYDDQQGVRHFVTEVAVESIYFLEPKGGNQSPQSSDFGMSQPSFGPQPSYNQQSNKQEDPFSDIQSQYDISNDDLPF